MGWPLRVAKRVREPELMDAPDLAPERHAHALRGLSRLNRWSGSVGIMWQPIARLAQDRNRPLRILDLATGAGDIPIGLWHRARRAGVPLDIRGVDLSQRAIQWAQQRADRAGVDVQFDVLDVLSEPLPMDFDVVISSLFLHHLNEDQAIQLLACMKRSAGSLVVVNDLIRCSRGLLLAHLAARLFTTSDVVHTDAALSVRAAFTVDEIRELASAAGLDDVQIRRRWPSRMLLTWRPHDE